MKLFNTERKYYIYRALVKRYALPVTALLMLDRGLSPAQIAFVATAGAVTSFILETPSGALADTLGHKKTLLYSMIGQALSYALYFCGSFWWFLAAYLLYRAAGSLMSGTDEAFFFEQLKQEGREKENSLYTGRAYAVANAVGIVSMVTASLLYVVAWWIPFAIGVIQFLLAYTVVSSMKNVPYAESVKAREGYAAVLYHFSSALKTIKKIPSVFWIVFLHGMVMGALVVQSDYHQLILESTGLAVALYGTFYAAKRFITMAVSPLSHWVGTKISYKTFYTGSVLVGGGVLLAMPLIHSPYVVLAVISLLVPSASVAKIAVSDYIQQRVPSESRATILSLNQQVRKVVEIAGGVLMTWLLVALDIQNAYFYLGLMLLVLGLFFSWRFARADSAG